MDPRVDQHHRNSETTGRKFCERPSSVEFVKKGKEALLLEEQNESLCSAGGVVSIPFCRTFYRFGEIYVTVLLALI